MTEEIIVGVDIGGTSMGAACIIDKTICKHHSVPTNANRSAEEVLNTLFELIKEVLHPNTLAIGIGVPGLLDTVSGKIINITNIPSWKNLNLKDKVQEKFNLPVYINNDANCLALGEKHFGKGRNYQNFVSMALGTGVGCGIIINNKVHSGVLGGTGEIGLWPYLDSHFEHYCGSAFFNKKNNISGKELFDQAEEGSKYAQTTFHEFGQHIGKLINNILYIVAPEAIIIGGSISKAFPYFQEGIQYEMLKNFDFKEMLNIVKIEQSELENIALLGAAGLYYNL